MQCVSICSVASHCLPSFTATDQATGHSAFQYEEFFGRKIQEKIDTNTYRQFRVVSRDVETFPGVKVVDDPSQAQAIARDVTVWCSNDYLGMGQHAAVRKAAMYVSLGGVCEWREVCVSGGRCV